MTVVTVLIDTLVATGYIRYAPDGVYTACRFILVLNATFVGYFIFASAFMLKVRSHPFYAIWNWPRL